MWARALRPRSISNRKSVIERGHEAGAYLSEQNLQGKLDLAGSSDNRCDGAGIGILSAAAVESAKRRHAEIGVIQNIETLGPELKIGRFGESRILGQVHIQRRVIRRRDCPTVRSARSAVCYSEDFPLLLGEHGAGAPVRAARSTILPIDEIVGRTALIRRCAPPSPQGEGWIFLRTAVPRRRES